MEASPVVLSLVLKLTRAAMPAVVGVVAAFVAVQFPEIYAVVCHAGA